MSELKLNLSSVARRHFGLADRRLSDEETKTVNAAIKFAHVCLQEYQRLEERSFEAVRKEYADSHERITARDLIAVVELNRSIRGRRTTAGDLWQALSFLLARDAAICDWQLVLDELEEIAQRE